MIKIVNPFIPMSGYTALTLWPFVLVRTDQAHRYNKITDRHERIHARQQIEMLAVGCAVAAVLAVCGAGWWSLAAVPLYLWWYAVEWLLRVMWSGSNAWAYRHLAFEREAYAHQGAPGYLDGRKPFAWLKYLRKPES